MALHLSTPLSLKKYIEINEGITLNNIRKETTHEAALRQLVIQYQNTLKKQLAIDGGCVDNLFRTLTTHENWKNE